MSCRNCVNPCNRLTVCIDTKNFLTINFCHSQCTFVEGRTGGRQPQILPNLGKISKPDFARIF